MKIRSSHLLSVADGSEDTGWRQGGHREVVLGTQWGDDRSSEEVMAMEMEKEDGL